VSAVESLISGVWPRRLSSISKTPDFRPLLFFQRTRVVVSGPQLFVTTFLHIGTGLPCRSAQAQDLSVRKNIQDSHSYSEENYNER
jgi:hypothetical protein